MKKIIYTLIAAFVACTAVAQTPSAYFMEGSTFRSQLNPAFAPLRGYVNIPVLGGVQVNVSGNLSVSDIFYPVNGSLVTLFDKNVSAAEALGNLRSKNMLGTDARINIVGFGAFRKDHKTFWSFDLNVRMEAESNRPPNQNRRRRRTLRGPSAAYAANEVRDERKFRPRPEWFL